MFPFHCTCCGCNRGGASAHVTGITHERRGEERERGKKKKRGKGERGRNIKSLFFYYFLLTSFWSMPTMIPGCFGRPTMEGKTALGASSPAKPALHIPDPLSTTKAWTSSSSSHIFNLVFVLNRGNNKNTVSESTGRKEGGRNREGRRASGGRWTHGGGPVTRVSGKTRCEEEHKTQNGGSALKNILLPAKIFWMRCTAG